jgi:hypothetical protein
VNAKTGRNGVYHIDVAHPALSRSCRIVHTQHEAVDEPASAASLVIYVITMSGFKTNPSRIIFTKPWLLE